MKQGKKEMREKSGSSLASRILLIALICLVFPLLALASFLYVEESRIKMNNNIFTLKILMDQNQAILAEMIEQSLNFLEQFSFFLPKIPPSDIPSILTELTKGDHLIGFFHIQKGKGGLFYVDETSNKEFFGKEYSELVAYAREKIPFVVDPSGLIFYLTRLEDNQREGWVIAFSLGHLLKNFPSDGQLPHPASISIVSREGMVLFSTNPQFECSFFSFPMGEKYEHQGVEYVTSSRRIPNTNFSLVIVSPAEINFVDFPKFIFKILWMLIGMIVLGGGVAFLMIEKLSKPLRELIVVMKEIEMGSLSRRFKEQKMGFEINAIGKIFNETVDSLEIHMQAVQKERIDKETYERELKIGEEVQRSILPKTVPHFPGIKIAAQFLPAKEVGGDFYDFLLKDRLMVSIADTSGKGVFACLYSLSVRSLLRSYGQIYQHLDRILKETNALFCQDTGQTGVFVTAFVGLFDPNTRLFHYSNCGHLPALRFKRDGSVEKLTTRGMALGVDLFDRVETRHIQLESGDLLILFTDGIVEAHNDQFEQFQERRLIDSILEKKEWEPDRLVQAVIKEVGIFAGKAEQFDDLSLIALKIL